MIHCVYLKRGPKTKWHLISMAISVEAAVLDVTEALRIASLSGNDVAEAGIQMYESAYHIPEFLSEMKQFKPMYN